MKLSAVNYRLTNNFQKFNKVSKNPLISLIINFNTAKKKKKKEKAKKKKQKKKKKAI